MHWNNIEFNEVKTDAKKMVRSLGDGVGLLISRWELVREECL
jgi:hypothetical protein